jgi:ankyrin repeat protein
LDQETPAKTEAAAQSIQFDLSLAYKNMLSRIHPQGLKLIHLVLFATRPLTLEGLRIACAIEDGMTDLDTKRQLPYPSVIDRALGLLVVDSDGQTVRFTHLTVKDYLLKHNYFPEGHSFLARICLTFLNFTTFSGEADRGRLLRGGDLYPFSKYAAFEWGHHVREAWHDLEQRGITLDPGWFVSKRFQQLRYLRATYHTGDTLLSSSSSPLHEACFFGLKSSVIQLLGLGQNINGCSNHRKVTPLHYAVRRNRLTVVQALLDHPDVDVNTQDAWRATPLHDASSEWHGHTNVAGLLLGHHSIQVNLRDQDGRTPLYHAAKADHLDIAQMLLKHPSINVNLADNANWTPLAIATVKGHTGIVRLLLSPNDGGVTACRSIDVNAADERERLTPLHHASKAGHTDIVQALFQQPSLEINAQDRFGWTALTHAVRNRHNDIVKALLQHSDLDVNHLDEWGRTPLTYAVEQGDAEIVQLLLDHNSSIPASRVGEPGFWESASYKYVLRLPPDLRIHLGIKLSPSFP